MEGSSIGLTEEDGRVSNQSILNSMTCLKSDSGYTDAGCIGSADVWRMAELSLTSWPERANPVPGLIHTHNTPS